MNPIPLSLKDANALVASMHRHHKPVVGHKFSIGCQIDGKVVGCVIVGRPTARMSDDGMTVEVTRLCTDGTRNACSFLYRAAWRAAEAIGYTRLLTYTLPEEGGASLRGAGFKCLGEAGGGSWSRDSRLREDKHPLQRKLKWELSRAIPGKCDCCNAAGAACFCHIGEPQATEAPLIAVASPAAVSVGKQEKERG